jgi:hypothetical protein
MALERQLILQGMKKKDAKRISTQYQKLKENILSSIKTSLRSSH